MSEPRDPTRAAQASMRPKAIRRFYRTVEVREADGGRFALVLDGRGARTPGGKALDAPAREIAEMIAAEWAGQGEVVDPASMPVTRLANSAIDGVARTMDATRAEIASYAGADLVCYRAEGPEALVELEGQAFDPVLDWVGRTLGARFLLSNLVVHVAQPQPALDAVSAALEAFADPFAVAALHVMTSLTGSALIALMVARGGLEVATAWRAAHVDEDFQIGQWGEDEEAARRREARWRDFRAAASVMAALQTGSRSR
jgi:chaperone required for assembly of F1-ATPase